MKILSRLMLIACLVLPFAACKKAEGPVQTANAPMSAPKNDDMNAWRTYLQDIVPRYMGAGANPPYVYLLPGESTPDFNDVYMRLAQRPRKTSAAASCPATFWRSPRRRRRKRPTWWWRRSRTCLRVR